MMKKKNLAVAMAAVTVAMPASQVFAAVVDNTQTEQIKAMKEKAKELMNLKYTTNGNLLNNPKNNDEYVFKIELTTPNNEKPEVCTSYAEFERKFDNAYAKLEDGQSLKIGYKYAQKDKANKEVGYNKLEDGQIVDFKLETYTEKELEQLAKNFDASTGKFLNKGTTTTTNPDGSTKTEETPLEIEVGQVRATELSDDGAKKFEIRLSNDKNGLERYKEIKVGDVEIALNAELDTVKNSQESNDLKAIHPIVRQVNDYYVDFNGNALASVEDGDVAKLVADNKVEISDKDGNVTGTLTNPQIDGFYANTETEAETPQIKMDVITKTGTQYQTLNSSDLFTVAEGRATTAGNDLLRQINFYRDLDQKLDQDKDTKEGKFYGDTYRVDKQETAKDKEITIKIFKTDEVTNKESKIAEVKVVRDDKDTKAESYKAIRTMLSGNYVYDENSTKIGYTRVAAGDDRYETAAEVSRMKFPRKFDNDNKNISLHEGKDGEKAVVLVTGEKDKLVDGLTATPLAAALNGGEGAPVLLTGNDKIAKPVLDEIERLGANKVYIVGGAISTAVEKELKDIHKLKVDRVSGDDRYETSIEVADEILEHTTNNKANGVFVVGGRGEADALSVASAAAKQKAPILLTNKDKLSKDVKFYISKTDVTIDGTDNKVFVVGGNASVSDKVYNDLLDLDKVGSGKIERLSGDNRQDTNAEVATRFFKDAKHVVVAKSDNNGMVDALGAGLYAGTIDTDGAPVILATNNLTEDQEDYLNKHTKIDKEEASKVMVGNGISSTIAKFIKNLSTK